MIFIVWIGLITLVLLFVAGARRAYTPTEIEAEYEEQYRALQVLERTRK